MKNVRVDREPWLERLRESELVPSNELSGAHGVGKALDAVLDPGAIVIVDGGAAVAAASSVLRTHRPGHRLESLEGAGAAYALGAKAAKPDRPVVVLTTRTRSAAAASATRHSSGSNLPALFVVAVSDDPVAGRDELGPALEQALRATQPRIVSVNVAPVVAIDRGAAGVGRPLQFRLARTRSRSPARGSAPPQGDSPVRASRCRHEDRRRRFEPRSTRACRAASRRTRRSRPAPLDARATTPQITSAETASRRPCRTCVRTIHTNGCSCQRQVDERRPDRPRLDLQHEHRPRRRAAPLGRRAGIEDPHAVVARHFRHVRVAVDDGVAAGEPRAQPPRTPAAGPGM